MRGSLLRPALPGAEGQRSRQRPRASTRLPSPPAATSPPAEPPPRAASPGAACPAAQPRLALLTLCRSKAILSSKSLTRSEDSRQCWCIAHLTEGKRSPQTLPGLWKKAAEGSAGTGRERRCPAPYLLPRLATRPWAAATALLRPGTSDSLPCRHRAPVPPSLPSPRPPPAAG